LNASKKVEEKYFDSSFLSFLCTVNKAVEYIKYLLKGKGAHGLHSPFLFDFYNFCCDKTRLYNAFEVIENERVCLLKNDRVLHVVDHGAGSRVLKNNERSIGQIAKTSLKPPKYAQLLFRLNEFIKADRVLELGTSLGTTAAYLAMSAKQVCTIEGDSSIQKEAVSLFNTLGVKNIDSKLGLFDEVLPELKGTFDMVFIDGHHDGEATISYLNELFPMLTENACVVLDDIRWSESMQEAWLTAAKDLRFNVSIDIFEMGILFKRPGQMKEHFIVRY